MRRLAALAVLLVLAPAAQAADIQLQGLLDVTASKGTPALELNRLDEDATDFQPYRLRLFAESAIPGGFQAFGVFLFDDALGAQVSGVYLSYQLGPPELGFDVVAGKMPWLIGNRAPRAERDRRSIVGTPVLYQYRTSLRNDAVPGSPDQLLRATGQGVFLPDYGSGVAEPGMPIVEQANWDVAAVVTWTDGTFEAMAGAENGTPSAPNDGVDWNPGKAFLGRVGFAANPGVRVGASGAIGPYLKSDVNAGLPPDDDSGDFDQKLLMVDVALSRGYAELYAEGAYNIWETPYTGDLRARAFYTELRYGLSNGIFGAARLDGMDFSNVTRSDGTSRSWDDDLIRIEGALGYRVNRAATVRLTGQQTQYVGDAKAERSANDLRRIFNLFSAQISLKF